MIKRLLFIALLFTNIIFAQIKFEKTLAATFEKAQKENKAVFIELYNEGCPYCQKVAPFLDSKEVGDAYNPIFASYKMSSGPMSEEDDNFLRKHKLFFTDVPNFIYFDKDENFLHYVSGKPDANFIIKQTKDVFDPNIQVSNIQNRILNGDVSLGTLYQYSLLAQLNQNKELADNIASTLYAIYDKNNLNSDTSFLILKNAVFTTQNGFFKHWVANQEIMNEFEYGGQKGNQTEILKSIISIDITNPDFSWTPELINEMNNYMLATNYTTKPENILVNKRIVNFNTNDPSKEIKNYFEPILKSSIYDIDDKTYILETISTAFTDKKSKKIIKTFASELKKQAEKTDNIQATESLNKIIKSSN